MKKKFMEHLDNIPMLCVFSVLLVVLWGLLVFLIISKPEQAKETIVESTETESVLSVEDAETETTDLSAIIAEQLRNSEETENQEDTEETEVSTDEISDTPVLDSIQINEDGTRAEPLEEQPNPLLDVAELAVKASEVSPTDFVIKNYDGYAHANNLAEDITIQFGYSEAVCVNSVVVNHDTLQQIVYRVIFDNDMNKRYYFYVSVDGCWAAKCEDPDLTSWE